jgi:hypothetical protein
MRRFATFPALALPLVVSFGVVAGCGTAPIDDAHTSVAGIPQEPSSSVCSGARWSCKARVRTDANGKIKPHATSSGLGPSDLASAYNLDTSVNPGATIAVVDAYGYANAESDLAAYRSHYGLPACTVASGCLKIVNQSGQTSPLPKAPPSNDDWTTETALDLDMASAACPNCKLLLVQADDDQGDGLYIAQAAAANLGASVISNSWGGPESSSDPGTNYEHYFQVSNSPSIFVAAGDSGYDDGNQGPDYPSTSAYVIGVGGTSLKKSSGSARGWTETAWSSGGSSCSTSIPKPSYQGNTSCNFRAASDVAAVGDPNTGLAVYNQANGGWIVVGGTSASSPFVAGVFALTGHAGAGPSFVYANTGSFYDVTSGSNGSCGNVLCKAGAGWDGPTGVGAPNGAKLAGGGGGCTPSCGGKQCGDDGCGGTCGTCGSGQTCSASGTCQGGGGCTPSCGGRQCGDDGCGGTCGTCGSGQTCDASGTCQGGGGCTPNCDGTTCGDDGCGGTCSCSNDSICFFGYCW